MRAPAGPQSDVLDEAFDALLGVMAPMTPHVTAELWERRHGPGPSIHARRWPEFDPELVRTETVTMVVQVNGKVRDRIEVDPAISEDDARDRALASPRVLEALAGAAPHPGHRPATQAGQRRPLRSRAGGVRWPARPVGRRRPGVRWAARP